jgi:hypothetical protein
MARHFCDNTRHCVRWSSRCSASYAGLSSVGEFYRALFPVSIKKTTILQETNHWLILCRLSWQYEAAVKLLHHGAPCHSNRRKQDEWMKFLVAIGVDAAPRLGQDPRWDNWSLLWERFGEEEGVCVVMCSCTRTDIICSGTDQYGSVAPVDVCRMSLSIAAPGQRLHGNTLQYWHRDSASGSAGSDAGR